MAFMATLSCLSLYSQAATVNADVTIKEIRVVGSGDLIVITNEPLGANCYTSDKQAKVYFHATQMSQNAINRILSLLLTAKTLSSVVSIYFDNSSRNCRVSSVNLK